jgi:hypothetical protein
MALSILTFVGNHIFEFYKVEKHYWCAHFCTQNTGFRGFRITRKTYTNGRGTRILKRQRTPPGPGGKGMRKAGRQRQEYLVQILL